jgi:hypothetical protein
MPSPVGPRKRVAFAAVGLLLTAAAGRADRLPERAPVVVEHDIEVSLDPETKQLTGSEWLVWHNPSSDEVGELWFHLYLNAFKNSESTFFRESGGQLRGDNASRDGWGWIDVSALRLADGTDLLPGSAFEQPDDGNPSDQTVMRVPLPAPVAPGGSVALEIGFTAQLPKVYARTGWAGDYFLVGQWFPKLGVYEPAGVRGRAAGGWNCHQFHADSEFYADFGRYRVAITLPSRFVVGATGERVDRRDNGDGTTTHVFVQEDVHDFAWTADPDFVEVRRTFSAQRDVTAQEYEEVAGLLGRTPDEVRLSDVEIILLLQPGHRPQAERHLEAARLGLKWLGLWYGRYPYRTLTVVDPAPGGEGSEGMEYPTFFTGGSSFLFNRWPLDRVRLPEETIIHEFAHQYWYGLMASNEFEEAWLDEGFATYATDLVMERGWPPDGAIVELFGLRLGSLELARLGNGADAVFDAIRQRSWRYSSTRSYYFNSYYRTDLALRTLAGLLGEPTMARVLRTYHERFRFRHPGSDDFYAVAEEVSGRDLDGFFAQLVERGELVDFEVARLTSRRVPRPRGVFDRDGGRETVGGDAEKGNGKEDGKGEEYLSTLLLRRRGAAALPVEFELRFDDGTVERRSWDGGERWVRYRFVRAARLVAVELDPDGKLPLDVGILDNGRRLDRDGRATAHWGARILFWTQQAIALAGM